MAEFCLRSEVEGMTIFNKIAVTSIASFILISSLVGSVFAEEKKARFKVGKIS
jgi:hypothetical protein